MTKSVCAVRVLLLCVIIQFLSIPLYAIKNEKSDFILVLNSYVEGDSWSENITNSLTSILAKDETRVKTEDVRMQLVYSKEVLDTFKETIFEAYDSDRPKVVIFLGGPAWLAFRDDVKERWGDIPTILCSEYDYITTVEDCLDKSDIRIDEVTPVEEAIKGYNVSVVYFPYYVKETVELMRQLLPDMKTLKFITDIRYVSGQMRYEMDRVIKQDFPDLNIVHYTPDSMTTDELIDSIKYSEHTGVLLYSWFQEKVHYGSQYLSVTAYKNIGTASSVPIFSLRSAGVAEGFLAGGCFRNNEETYSLLEKALRNAMNGKKIATVGIKARKAPITELNYEVLQKGGVSESLYPNDAIYYMKPENFFMRNRYFFITLTFLLLIVYLFWYRLHMLGKNAKLKEQEMKTLLRFKSLINNMPIIYMKEEVMLDESGNVKDYRVVDVNPMFENKFTPREAVIGKSGSAFAYSAFNEAIERRTQVLKDKKTITYRLYIPELNEHYNVMLFASEEKNIIDVFMIDMTSLRKAQYQLESVNHKLSLAFEVANIIPWKWDLKNKLLLCDVNKPVKSVGLEGGISSDEEYSVPQDLYFSRIFNEDRERVMQAYHDLLSGKISRSKEEYRIVTSSTTYEWVEVQATVDTRDEKGNPLTMVGSSLVITARKRMEQEMEEARNYAEESNRLKSAFLANMSHEIRTPLNAIVGFSGILAETEQEEEKKEYLSIIENNNALLLQLIGDILDLSKIEAGTLEFVYSDVDVNTLLHDIERAVRLKVDTEKVKVNFIEGMPECFIHTEKNRLTQVIHNFLNNAVKFTQEGNIDFGYRLMKEGLLYFYVTDTGCGIPEDKQEQVFGRFVKLNTFVQGTGLGLSICETIVQKLGGKIGVDSVEGKGSTFWFTIPYLPVCIRKEISVEEEVEKKKIEKNKLTILVAEDNPSNYKLFEFMLRNDFHLIHAWNGREAVDLFKQYNPHLVLMDINMPELNGYEATTEIRKISKSVPIIAVTAYAYATDEERIMSSGFTDYASKPINAKALKDKIFRQLSQRIIFI